MTTVTVRPLTDVHECARVARFTQGVEGDSLTLATWRRWLWSEHSMIRVFILAVEIRDIPYFASVHLVRHKIGVEHFARSQRPTSMNPVGYDRRKASQDAPVDHTMVLNPQVLVSISRRRLCNKADTITQSIWRQVRDTIAAHDNLFVAAIAGVMIPNCKYRGKCHEMRPCGKSKKAEMNEYRYPYCGCLPDDADATHDGVALYCAKCDEVVEFFDALGEAERRDR